MEMLIINRLPCSRFVSLAHGRPDNDNLLRLHWPKFHDSSYASSHLFQPWVLIYTYTHNSYMTLTHTVQVSAARDT
jgi:hypothetical protein